MRYSQKILIAIPLLVIAGYIMTAGCSGGELITGSPPPEVVTVTVGGPGNEVAVPTCTEKQYLSYNAESNIYECKDKDTGGLKVPVCKKDEIIVFNPDKKVLACESKMGSDLEGECHDKTFKDGQCADPLAYKIFLEGSAIPSDLAKKGCSYVIHCRKNSTVGSDFNGDGIDDIAVSAPTSQMSNNISNIFTSLMAMFGQGALPSQGLANVGGKIHLMLRRNPETVSNAIYDTDNTAQIQIKSDIYDNADNNPTHMLGMSTLLSDINDDGLADLIFTANNFDGRVNDYIYILFGTKGVNPNELGRREFSPNELVGKDVIAADGKVDMAAIVVPNAALVQVVGLELFDYNGDGKKDLAISIHSGNENSGVKNIIYLFNHTTLNRYIKESSELDIHSADINLRILQDGDLRDDAFGSQMVGVDIDRNGGEELAVTMVDYVTEASPQEAIAIIGTDGEKLDPVRSKLDLHVNKQEGVRDNLVLNGVIVDKDNNSSIGILSMDAANINEDEETTDKKRLKRDDLVIGMQYKFTDADGVEHSEFGTTHLVGVVLGGTRGLRTTGVTNLSDLLDISIWGNKDDPDIETRCGGQILANLGLVGAQMQKDPSALGVDIAVIPGGDRPDSLAISDPRYDLYGFCPADWRLPRIFKFEGSTGDISGDWYATRDGIARIMVSSANPMPYIEPQAELLGAIRWFGWKMGLVGSAGNRHDMSDSFDLFAGVPATVDLGVDIPLFTLISEYMGQAPNPLVLALNLSFDFGGEVDVFEGNFGNMQIKPYADYTIRPSLGDYVDLLSGFDGGVGFDLGQLLGGIIGGASGSSNPNPTPSQAEYECQGTFLCDDVNHVNAEQVWKTYMCGTIGAGHCKQEYVDQVLTCVDIQAGVEVETNCDHTNMSQIANPSSQSLCELMQSVSNCTWTEVAPAPPGGGAAPPTVNDCQGTFNCNDVNNMAVDMWTMGHICSQISAGNCVWDASRCVNVDPANPVLLSCNDPSLGGVYSATGQNMCQLIEPVSNCQWVEGAAGGSGNSGSSGGVSINLSDITLSAITRLRLGHFGWMFSN